MPLVSLSAEHWDDVGGFWSLQNLEKVKFAEYVLQEETHGMSVDPSSILNHPCPVDLLYPPGPTPDPPSSGKPVELPKELEKILGPWNGFLGDSRWPASAMISFTFIPSSPHPDMIETRSITAGGTEFTLLGNFTASESKSGGYGFTRVFADGKRPQYFLDDLGTGDMVLSGSWGTSVNRLPFQFHFSRIPPQALI
ncbi:hypothetical protein C2E23DRAFT_9482 [Lenzites betulinus]|nr:hypothetical protein C2E23DRAFT_9482 [Lenzites betulinus]